MHGGEGKDQYGGSGTIYLAQTNNGSVVHKQLITDNAGYSASHRIQEVEKLPLEGGTESPASQVVMTPAGVKIEVDKPIKTYDCEYACSYRRLAYLISGSATDNHFKAAASEATLTMTFPFTTYVDHLRMFPDCGG